LETAKVSVVLFLPGFYGPSPLNLTCQL
jgi:hypothetical protein